MERQALQARTAAMLPGIAAMAALAAAAVWLAAWPPLAQAGIGALTAAIVLGAAAGNLAPAGLHRRLAAGAGFSQRTVLRLGVALYGLRLTAQQIGGVGLRGVLIDLAVIVSTLALAVWAGTRWLGLDRQTALLVGTGSAVCGAAAVMAAEPVIKAPPHKVAVAVATVTVFGSAATVVYPLLFPWLGMDASHFGIYIGSTVHEVAQVVAAGKAVGAAAADQAVIVKLIRVAMLAPVLAVLSRWHARGDSRGAGAGAPMLPWFIVLFVAAAAANSAGWIPVMLRAVLLPADNLLLAVAMAALGWATRVQMLRQAGMRPLLLGAVLFAFLLFGGYAINRAVAAALAC